MSRHRRAHCASEATAPPRSTTKASPPAMSSSRRPRATTSETSKPPAQANSTPAAQAVLREHAACRKGARAPRARASTRSGSSRCPSVNGGGSPRAVGSLNPASAIGWPPSSGVSAHHGASLTRFVQAMWAGEFAFALGMTVERHLDRRPVLGPRGVVATVPALPAIEDPAQLDVVQCPLGSCAGHGREGRRI